MRSRLMTWLLLGLLGLGLVMSPAILAQQAASTPPPAVSVLSLWLRLSLRGYTQQEIESVLRNLDEGTLVDVKSRLRRNVLSNLRLLNVQGRFAQAQDRDDLVSIRHAIETELRFAGLGNDDDIVRMIKDEFGIQLSRL